MFRISAHRSVLVLPFAAGALLLAGCGTSTANGVPPSSFSTPTTTAASVVTPPPAATPAATSTSAVPPTPVVTGSVAAIVNGHAIPISTYRELLILAQREGTGQPLTVLAQNTMQEVIFDELIREYAAAHHITVSPAEVTAQEQHDEQTAGGVTAFKQQLAQYGLTLASYRVLIVPNLLAPKVEKVVAPLKPARSSAAAHAIAEHLLTELHHGASFAALARKYSEDPGSASKGGDLGTVYPGEMVAPFDKAVFSAPVNKIVLVHTQFGWHLIQVLSRGKAAPPGQPGAKKVETAHVRHILISTQPQGQQQQQTKFTNWLHKLEKSATIKQVAKVKS